MFLYLTFYSIYWTIHRVSDVWKTSIFYQQISNLTCAWHTHTDKGQTRLLATKFHTETQKYWYGKKECGLNPMRHEINLLVVSEYAITQKRWTNRWHNARKAWQQVVGGGSCPYSGKKQSSNSNGFFFFQDHAGRIVPNKFILLVRRRYVALARTRPVRTPSLKMNSFPKRVALYSSNRYNTYLKWYYWTT